MNDENQTVSKRLNKNTITALHFADGVNKERSHELNKSYSSVGTRQLKKKFFNQSKG